MKRRHRRKRRHYTTASSLDKPGGRHLLSAPNPLFSPSNLTVMGYGPSGYEERTFSKPEEITEFKAKWPVLWVDVDGLGNTDMIVALGKLFCLPTLVLEDVFDVTRLPKIEEYEKFLFIILKNGLCHDVFETEQISMIVMEGLVITVQEKPGDSFTQVRSRIRDGAGKIRQFGADYLCYALIDATLEGYFPILEKMKRRLDAVEDTFIEVSGHNVIHQIHDIKNDLLFMHSAVWPVRDIMLTLAHDDDIPLIKPATAPYMRDCQDQAKQVTELTEFYRLIASDLMNTYLAFSDNKANEIMKVLTMVAAIFIPLSFVTSLYGMNFDRSSPYNMPELGSRYGYPILLAFMATMASGTIYMFWRVGWIGKRRRFRPLQD